VIVGKSYQAFDAHTEVVLRGYPDGNERMWLGEIRIRNNKNLLIRRHAATAEAALASLEEWSASQPVPPEPRFKIEEQLELAKDGVHMVTSIDDEGVTYEVMVGGDIYNSDMSGARCAWSKTVEFKKGHRTGGPVFQAAAREQEAAAWKLVELARKNKEDAGGVDP
jgi:hypothetical protein